MSRITVRNTVRDTNLATIDNLLHELKLGKVFLDQIEKSKATYDNDKKGFINDDCGCSDAFYSSVHSFANELKRYIEVVEKNRLVMINNSDWAGEDAE